MALHLYNTLARRAELFTPQDPLRVTVYICGPTVWNRAHIGNARPPVVFDVLMRLLRGTYGNENVIYARNVTDVDDKINQESSRTGQSIGAITAKYEAHYLEDMAALGVAPPDIAPHATAHIAEMIALMETLIAKGAAYVAEGHVLFNVPQFGAYGKLSGRNRDDMIAGARVEIAPYKKDPADFVMWKPSSPEMTGWESPWGRGRPGWHIECSAMIAAHLGTTIDIHAGGQDLIFPHHENEIAQSEAANGAPLAHYWLHNGFLSIDAEKMSKSIGNVLLISDILASGVPGEVIRFAILSGHYRQPLDWSDALVEQSKRTLDRLYGLLRGEDIIAGEISPAVRAALEDDLNTPKALSELAQLATTRDLPALKASAALMGLLQADPQDWFAGARAGTISADEVELKIAHRQAAKAARNYAEADAIRDALLAAGIILEDGKAGTSWKWA
jgi:cysteinyl-tRNA synthetase